jgi:hypothetical protein
MSARKFDIVPVIIEDPLENKMPKTRVFMDIEGLEDGRRVTFAPNGFTQQNINSEHNQKIAYALKLFAACGADFIRINTARNTIDPIVKFFKQRAKKLRK